MVSSPVLEVRRLAVRAGGRPIIAAAAFEVGAGEVVSLSGPSGVGKSTLLRSLNRLAELSGLAVDAEVRLAGDDLYRRGVDADELRRRIGFVFQQPVVFPKSVAANVALGLKYSGLDRRQRRRRVEAALARAALLDEVADRLDEDARALSVGQQQRLCLARALAVEPEILLLDEPTSALDPAATAAIERLIGELAARMPVLIVTHDREQAARVADRRLALVAGPDGARLTPIRTDDPTQDRTEDPTEAAIEQHVEHPLAAPGHGALLTEEVRSHELLHARGDR